MEYLLSFLLLSLNLLDYEIGLNDIVFLSIGATLFVGLFFVVQKKTKDFLASCLCMFCHTWQISWINILGDPTSELQLPWFYIIGVLVCIYAIFNFSDIFRSQINAGILITFVIAFVISLFPLLNSVSISEGLKEYIMIGFYLAMVFIAFLLSGKIPRETREHIADAYIWCVFISSVFIIVQAISYHVFSTVLFKYSVGNYMGNRLTSSLLLMEDTSCSTIMLGSAIFYIVEKIEKKQNVWWHVIEIVTVVIAMAFTTRRTSVISLIIMLSIYAVFHYKGVIKKTGIILLFGALMAVMILYLLVARPVDDLSSYLYDNNRFANYWRSVELSVKYPFGVGYDNTFLASLMTDNIIPHNTLLRWLVMGGFPFAVSMLLILYNIVKTAFKKKLTAEYWIILYSLFASNFIPDILNARFFVIPCMCVMLVALPPKNNAKPVLRYGR